MIWRPLIPLMLLAVLVTNVSADTSSTNSIERYKIIMEKSPFKRFSDPVSSTPGVTAGNLTLQGFFADGKDKKVWLRDSSQNNKTLCVGEGETLNGYHVDKIDTENQSVTLTHGVETLSLKFPEKNPAAPAPMAAAPLGFGRPVYRNPRVAMPPGLQAPVAPPLPAGTAPRPLETVVPSHNPNTNVQHAASPTSLRRRILRQIKPAQPPAAKEDEKDAEGQAMKEKAEEKAEEVPAAQ